MMARRRTVHCILATTILIASAMAADTSKEFFRPAADESSKYDPTKVYPHGRIFPFSLYSVGGGSKKKVNDLLTEEEIPAALKRVKQDCFTMIGPQYELNDRVVSDAKAKGLKCLYGVGISMEFLSKNPRQLTPEDVEKEIREQVSKVVGHPEIAWWYLTPEEMRYWRTNEMQYMEAAVKAIRETDPMKRPVWMYDPGHRNAAALAYTAKRLDICGKGMYTNYSGQRDSRIWVRWTIEQEIEAIKNAKPSAIPIAVPEMFQQPPDDLIPMIPKWVRHDVYLSLITGAKGIVVFSMRERPKFHAHEAYYQAYAACAREINGPMGLGQVFLFGERRNDVQVRVTSGPTKLVLDMGERIGRLEYRSVNFLDVAHGEARYLFLANSANEPVDSVVEGLPTRPFVCENLFEGAAKRTVSGGKLELKLAPLEVKAFRFTP